MKPLDQWLESGREVSVAGMGKSGLAAARLLSAYGIPVYLSDQGAKGDAHDVALALIQESGPGKVSVDIGHHDLARVMESAAMIVSPGILPSAGVVQAAVSAGVPVWAEAGLGLAALPGVPCIAITGTNGKTTTTALTNHLLQSAGRRSVAVGNIGLPICTVALQAVKPDWLVAELSSFQLHDMPDVQPVVGILTNLAPDHLDRYPSAASYYADKAELFANANPGSIWIGNLDDPASREMLQDVPGRHLAFTVARGVRADAYFDHDTDMLMLAGKQLLPRSELNLLGDHNVANALAAALAVHTVGIPHDQIRAGLPTFQALTHRLEPVREVGGVLWINDSKATNVASTEVAARGMTRPFVLLLGGRHKGEPYTSLIPALAQHCVAVVAYGEATKLIEHDLSAHARVIPAGTFAEVVATAQSVVPAGGAVLLSPACSSFDMFSGYEARGAAFRQMVEAM